MSKSRLAHLTDCARAELDCAMRESNGSGGAHFESALDCMDMIIQALEEVEMLRKVAIRLGGKKHGTQSVSGTPR